MTPSRRRSILFALALATAGCAAGGDRSYITLKPSWRVADRLADVWRAELFAISPSERSDDVADCFHGYPILGRGVIDDPAEADAFAHRVGGAVLEPPESVGKYCIFVPHHAIRFEKASGQHVDLVLCFQCGDALVFVDEKKRAYWLSKSAGPGVDEVFRAHGAVSPTRID